MSAEEDRSAPAHPATSQALEAEIKRLAGERDAARAEAEQLRRRLAEVEQLADRDPLTPVLNRRAFMRELQRAAAFCARYGGTASLIYFDLDGFKAVNDRFGHAAGDAVLEAVARGLLDHVRETDVVGRLGGDEFGVLLAQADQGVAEAKARGLIADLQAEPIGFGGLTVAIGVSAGVRAYEPNLTPARWLAEADAAMFLYKGSSGRGSSPKR